METLLAEKDIRIASLQSEIQAEVEWRKLEIARLEALLGQSRQVAKAPAKPGVKRVRAEKKPDDLELIWGIGPVLRKRLNALGISYFRQIAKWNEKDVQRFQDELKTVPDRIQREEWGEQASRMQHEKNPKEIRPAKFKTATATE